MVQAVVLNIPGQRYVIILAIVVRPSPAEPFHQQVRRIAVSIDDRDL